MQANPSKRLGTYFLLGLLLLVLWVVAGFWAVSERHRVIEARELELARLNIAVEEQTLRLFKLAEATAVTMARWIEDHPEVYPGGDPAFISLVNHLRRLSDNVFEIRIIDEQGGAHLVPSSIGKPVANLADREHFRVQQDSKTRGLFISDAVFSHVNSKWVLPVSYPVLKPDGTVMTIAVSIQLERLVPAFEVQRYKPGGSITLIKTNGATLFRVPAVEGAIGRSISASPEFSEHLNATDSGQYRTQAGLYDKSQRLISHSRLTAYPLIVAVTLNLDDALVPWRDEMYRLLGALLAVSVTTVLFAYRFRRAETVAGQRLANSEKRFRSLIEHAPEAILVYDVDAKLVVDANPQAEKLFGCSRSELLSGGVERFYAPIQPDGLAVAESVRRGVSRVLAGESIVTERLVRTVSGKEAVFEVRVEDMSEDGRRLVRGSYYDITERKLAEQVVRESEARFRALVDTSPLPMLICSPPPENVIMLMNQRFIDTFGYTMGDVCDVETWWPLAYPDSGYRVDVQQRWAAAIDEMQAAGVSSIKPICAEVSCKDGGKRYVEIHMTVHVDRALVVFNDLTERRANELELDHIAHYDSLTGVANRSLLSDRLHQAIAHAERSGELLAVCYLDLDGFKPINDLYGHEAGDRLLVEIAERLRSCLRDADTLGRLGGDEFVILLLGLGEVPEYEVALQRILEMIKQPVFIAGNAVSVSASIGVTLYPLDHADSDTLLRHADQAMYEAKHAGKNRYQLFNPENDRLARKHRETVERMQLALESGELVLHYQPKVDMRLAQVIGAEALIRWQHPERGLLPPAEFLPHIESSDVIVALGDWVIGEALRQSAAWRLDGLSVSVSVNIAARHLQRPDFVSRLQAHLAARSPLPPDGRLDLEVLETTALEDMSHISLVIAACRELGVRFALDDFGTGYSSLSYLRRLPADTLKIDQSFVRDMLRDPEDRAIVAGIIRLAETFGRGVIAEGVESVDAGRALLALGCSQAQGYGIARPMPAAEFLQWARSWPDAVWGSVGSSDSVI
jgi:diguanylate cyclase (GGDEF)-like protein/PAS domain S-box-containing protein